MKVCPVCSESFGDEFSFCDIDGTKLKRDAASPPEQNKMWSLLGVGLLIGAVVITAAAIIFMRKAPVSPAVARSSETQSSSAPAKTGSDDALASAAPAEQGEINANLSSVIAKKKAQDLTNANVADTTVPDVKSVVQPAEPGETLPQPDATAVAPPPAPPKPETPVVETRAPEPAPKSVEPPAEKKESKPAAKNGKDSDDKKKKNDDKDKKKGGGFLKVFKKIFGKD
jgi:cell division septation protein DedD